MPLLSLTIGNIKIFTFLSLIFISSFLVLQSFVNYDLKGLAYLIGTLIMHKGMLVKLFFIIILGMEKVTRECLVQDILPESPLK